MQPLFTIRPRRITISLTLIALSLALMSYLLEAYEWSLGVNNTYWAKEVSDLFNVTFEGNIPTWYSTLLLLSAAGLSALIAQHTIVQSARWRVHWVGLALLFLYLSIDEAAAVHEAFTTPIRETFNTTGVLYFGWIAVGIPFALVMGLLFLPFVWQLPPRVRWTMMLGGIVYITGVLVVESFGSRMYFENGGIVTPRYTALGGLEEFLEMWGVIIAIDGLLAYIQQAMRSVTIDFSA